MGKMSVECTQSITNQTGNLTVSVKYAKPFATLDVKFSDYLDVSWNMTYDIDNTKIHGLVGMFSFIAYFMHQVTYFQVNLWLKKYQLT